MNSIAKSDVCHEIFGIWLSFPRIMLAPLRITQHDRILREKLILGSS